MSLDPSRLRHIVRFEEKRVVVDEDGERTESWVVVFPRVYAAVEPLSVRDLMAAGAEQSEVSARIVVRWRPGFHHGMRIVHGEEVYHIKGLQRDPESGLEWLTIPVSLGLRDSDPINLGGQNG